MWQVFDKGSSLGQRGSERGEIIRDEEHSVGARITIERGGSLAPFAITCGVYGWMVHTRFFSTEAEARSEYDKMKASLSEILEPLNYRELGKEHDTDKIIDAVHAFVENYR
jgi:hypothetical protein